MATTNDCLIKALNSPTTSHRQLRGSDNQFRYHFTVEYGMPISVNLAHRLSARLFTHSTTADTAIKQPNGFGRELRLWPAYN